MKNLREEEKLCKEQNFVNTQNFKMNFEGKLSPLQMYNFVGQILIN